MAQPSLQDIEDAIAQLVLPFYRLERDMLLPGKDRRNENDAEHSWSLAVIACALAPQVDPKLNVGLVAQFGLVHDMPEIYAEDTSVWDDAAKLASKDEREAQATAKIAKEFTHLPWIAETIEAYERKDTDEAKFIYALDKLIALLIRRIDEGKYYVDRGITKEIFQKGLAASRKKAQSHPAIGTYYEELWTLFEKHPEYFYRGA